MALTRRSFVAACGSALIAPHVSHRPARAETTANRLPVLPSLDARESGMFRLTAISGEHEFVPGTPSPALGFNQPYLGPILRVRSGSSVRAIVENRTGRPVSAHWHGLLVEGSVDGGPHNAIADGETWSPTLQISQPAATLWYHTHVHGMTAETVYAGLAGLLIIDDGNDSERDLPASDGVDDIALVLQDKRLDQHGRANYEPGPPDIVHGFLGNAILANGAVQPHGAVPAGIVRLRLLNASNSRIFDLSFSDSRPLHLIASDQGLLPAPIETPRLRLTPGERAEVLIDFASGGGDLISLPHAESQGSGSMDHGTMAPALEDPFAAPFTVLSLAVDPGLPVAIRSVPASIGESLPDASEPVTTRRFTLNDMAAGMAPTMGGGPTSGGQGGQGSHMMGGGMMMPMGGPSPGSASMFAINGQPFSMDRLDFSAAAGTTERWIVASEMMGHPFHVHGARMRVISENDHAPRTENSGWKDTVFVDGELEMLVELANRAPREHPFMYHCHILEHEDRGMMGQFAVA